MKRQVILTGEPIDEHRCLDERERDASSGAIICFLGTVRDVEGQNTIEALDYEAFEKMAYHQFHLILDHIEATWPIRSVRLIHRTGKVAPGHPSLWIEVMAPHRKEAFAACEKLIDEMKQRVPIWKKPVLKGFKPV